LQRELAVPLSGLKRKYHGCMEDMGAWLFPMRMRTEALLQPVGNGQNPPKLWSHYQFDAFGPALWIGGEQARSDS
jgi:hypothetical protein